MTLIPPLGPPGTLWDPPGWSQGVPEVELKLEFNGKVARNNGPSNFPVEIPSLGPLGPPRGVPGPPSGVPGGPRGGIKVSVQGESCSE